MKKNEKFYKSNYILVNVTYLQLFFKYYEETNGKITQKLYINQICYCEFKSMLIAKLVKEMKYNQYISF